MRLAAEHTARFEAERVLALVKALSGDTCTGHGAARHFEREGFERELARILEAHHARIT